MYDVHQDSHEFSKQRIPRLPTGIKPKSSFNISSHSLSLEFVFLLFVFKNWQEILPSSIIPNGIGKSEEKEGEQ
jgi:hypothetical protein